MAAAEFDIAGEDRLRADLYDFLGALLARPADKPLLDKCAALSGDETPLGKSIGTLARVARGLSTGAVESEFNTLFIGVGRGELLPYGSYYLTGFLNEKPLSALRDDMARLGVTRARSSREPEDNIASLMEMMAGLIMGRFDGPLGLAGQREFWGRHVEPWAEHFFNDLEGARNSVFYAPVGAIGRAFMEIEREAFRMAAGPTRE